MKQIETCQNCGSKYELTSVRIHHREKDSLFCIVCGFEYYIYNDAKSWYDKLIERHENHLGSKSKII